VQPNLSGVWPPLLEENENLETFTPLAAESSCVFLPAVTKLFSPREMQSYGIYLENQPERPSGSQGMATLW